MSKIINLSLKTGIHPDNLKIAEIIPIFKKGSRLKASNYRPISLLSNINKIFEKVVFNRVYNFLHKYDCFYKNQFGFRPKHSTEHALINITEKIKETLDANSRRRKYACGIFVDFQKAFDTVNPNILIEKLDHYGIRGPMNKWFKSYLENRLQYVSILGYKSQKAINKHGVPQGSVLGPLLFLIYINDLHAAINYSETYHFADDTSLLLIEDSYKKIQKKANLDLKFLYKWLLANKISLNTEKTELLFFCKPSEELPDIKIKINGQKIYPTSHIKYLGVFLDEFLDGSKHCTELEIKLRRLNGMLFKISQFLSTQELISFYHATFSSTLLYGCQIWGHTTQTTIRKLEILQNSAIRTILRSDDQFKDFHLSNHITPFYKYFKILKFRDSITLKNTLFAHDFINKKLPASFSQFFSLQADVSTTSTRNSAKGSLSLTHINTQKYGKNSIKHKAMLAWNKLISNCNKANLKNMSKMNFKAFHKESLMNSY